MNYKMIGNIDKYGDKDSEPIGDEFKLKYPNSVKYSEEECSEIMRINAVIMGLINKDSREKLLPEMLLKILVELEKSGVVQ